MRPNHSDFRKSVLATLSVLTLSAVIMRPNQADAQSSSAKKLQSISAESMRPVQTAKGAAVVLWMSPQYIRALGESSGMPESEIAEAIGQIKDYSLFLVLYKKFDGGFSQRIVGPDEILKPIRFVDQKNVSHKPIAEDTIDKDALVLAEEFSTVFQQKIGLKMKPILFSAKGAKGQELANAARKGEFKIQLDDLSLTWTLPLKSVAGTNP